MNRPNSAEEQEAARLEEFLNTLHRDPQAEPAGDLDPAMAEITRLAAESERANAQPGSQYLEAARKQVWQKALASVEIEKVTPQATPSSQGNLTPGLSGEGQVRSRNGSKRAVLLPQEQGNKTRPLNWPRLVLGGMAATIVVILLVFVVLLLTPGPQTPVSQVGSGATQPIARTTSNPAVRVTPTQPPQPTPTPVPSYKVILQIATDKFTGEQANATAKVLENRMLALGFTYARATVDGGQINMILRGTIGENIVKGTASAPGRVEFVDITGGAYIQVGEQLQTTYCTTGSLLRPQTGLCVPTAFESDPKFTPQATGRTTIDGKVFQTIITGEEILSDSLVIKKNDNGFNALDYSLKPEAATVMKSFTESHQGKQMAITMSGGVVVVATIQGIISDKVEITSTTDMSLTNFIAMVKSGPLPLPLYFVDIS